MSFDAATSIEALTAAWAKTLANGGSAGGDGETLAQFARHADFRLARLSHEIRAGLYMPGPLRRVSIPKRPAYGQDQPPAMRVLSIPCIIDRIAQRAAADVMAALLEPQFEDTSFAYRPGRSVRQAVAKVDFLRRQGFRYVVDADIRAFFDEVPHAPLLAKLGPHGIEPRLEALVAGWLASFSANKRGLAQGSPLSPLLANLHLDALDEAFDAAKNANIRIVRFADDFVLLTKTKPGAEGALAKAQALLAAEGLHLNLAKTRIVPWEQAFEFLGHLFVQATMLERDDEDDRDDQRAILSAGGRAGRNAAYNDGEAQARAALVDLTPEIEPHIEDASDALPIVRVIKPVADPLMEALNDSGIAANRDEHDFAAGLAPLYVLEAGCSLAVEGEGFSVMEHGRSRLRLPAHMVGRIDLGAEVEASDAALRLAAAHHIPVALLNEAGLPQAVLTPAIRDDAGLHMAQAGLALDPKRAAHMAGVLAGGRIRNAQALLKRLNRRRADENIEAACNELHRDWRKAETARTVEAARQAEAKAAQTYWPALGACLEHGFTLRARRSQTMATAVNAALDYTASLLTRDMRAAVLRARLHPGFGVLHVAGDGRDACVYDLMEAFRAPLAEGLTIYLFNNRILRESDFVKDGGTAIRFTPAASRKLVQAWEAWVARPVKDTGTGRASTWRGLLLIEARRYAKTAEDHAPFTPYRLKH